MANVPGLYQPTVASYPGGANSPHTAAIALNNANNQKLQNINQMAAGSKKRYRGRGGATNSTNSISVPTVKPIYNSGVGANADPVAQQASLSKNSMQSASWSANDSHATKMGGYRRRHTHRRRKSRKSRKSRRSRRHR